MTKHTRWPAGAQKCCTPKCCRWPRKAKWWCGCAIPSIRRHAAHGLGRPATFPTRFCREVRHEPASSGREEWPNAAKRARKPAGQEHGKKMARRSSRCDRHRRATTGEAARRTPVVRTGVAPTLDCDFVFSALDSSVAGPVEEDFARAGYPVVSNSTNHRMDVDVPLLIPEVNAAHLAAIPVQQKSRGYDTGFIVTNPNCSTAGLVLVLKPLADAFGLERIFVVTLQAISGAGYPGVAS